MHVGVFDLSPRLARSEEAELARMEAALRKILIKNGRRVLVELPVEYRRERDPQLMDEMTKPRP